MPQKPLWAAPAAHRPARCPLLLGWLVVACLGAGSAQAQSQAHVANDALALRARSLAATCAQCHGTDGRPVAGSLLPALAGLPAATLRAQMQAFKKGTLPASVMTQLARGFSDAQIDQLADFFAAQTLALATSATPATPSAKDPS